MWTTATIVWLYGALVLEGGGMGWAKTQSKPSLISGLVFGLLLVADGLGLFCESHTGLMIALALPALLALIMGVRVAMPRKFMPAGLMFVLSLLALVMLFLNRPSL
jgi:uncharacterized membrane protein (UPF0136 family)